jgi:hypothetical protein
VPTAPAAIVGREQVVRGDSRGGLSRTRGVVTGRIRVKISKAVVWSVVAGVAGGLVSAAGAEPITRQLSNDDALVVQHFGAFNSLAPIDLVFSQVVPGGAAAMRLVVDESFIRNNTGFLWNTFTLEVLGQTNGTAAINQPLSSTYVVTPEFTERQFNEPGTLVSFAGGTGVPVLRTWTPGLANGALVIDVAVTGPGPVSFTLRGTPGVIPAPGAAVLLGLSGVLAARRRRAAR